MRAFFEGRSITTFPTAACESFFFRYSRTFTSSRSIPGKFLLFANHFEPQLRFTERRNPIGLIFCPMASPFAVADGEKHVAGRLDDAVAAALGARLEALEHRALLHADAGDLQLVDVGAVVVLGVRDRALEHLLDDLGALLRREGKDVERVADRLSAHEVGDEAAFLGREPHAVEFRIHVHRGFLYFFGAAGAGTDGAATLRSAEWPLKVRVSANSPSLWPTMFSVTYTGMCCLPLWTAMVRPTKSGRIVERRDHVLIGRLSFEAEATSTFFMRCPSTNGPFLIERAIAYPLGLLVAAAHDHRLRALVAACLLALGRLSPRRHRMAVAARAAPERVVDRVHRLAAHRRADAAPAIGAGLPDHAQVVLLVAHFTDGRAAVHVHAADLARAHAKLRVVALTREKLHASAGRARDLRALARQHLDTVHRGADRDVAKRQRVPGLDGRFRARLDLLPDRDALGRDHVAALAIGVHDERDVGAAVGV